MSNLHIDKALLMRAQQLGRHQTKGAAVNEALAEYVRRREQLKIFDLAGTIDFDPGYDYKKQRRHSSLPIRP
jgi:hypothetical protein